MRNVVIIVKMTVQVVQAAMLEMARVVTLGTILTAILEEMILMVVVVNVGLLIKVVQSGEEEMVSIRKKEEERRTPLKTLIILGLSLVINSRTYFRLNWLFDIVSE